MGKDCSRLMKPLPPPFLLAQPGPLLLRDPTRWPSWLLTVSPYTSSFTDLVPNNTSVLIFTHHSLCPSCTSEPRSILWVLCALHYIFI